MRWDWAAKRIKKTCPGCGVSFTLSQSQAHKTYCGKACKYEHGKRLHPTFDCLICGKTFSVEPYRAKTAKTCSAACRQIYIARSTVAERANRKRFTGEGKGYVKFMNRHLHRVLAENKLGRPLNTKEVVHHVNGNHRDNRLENLAVLETQAAHAKLHYPQMRAARLEKAGY